MRAAAEIDVSDAFAAMQCVAATVAVRCVDVSEPPHAWQGVKVQLSYTDFFGDRVYRDATLPRGTFDRTNVTVRVSPLLAPLGIPGGRVSLLLGLEGCSGRAEFDLSSLRIDREDTGIPPAVGANDGAPQSGAMTGAPLAQMTGAAARQMTGAPAAQMNDGSPFAGSAGTLHSREAGPSFAGSAGTLHSAEGGPSLHAAAQRRPPLRGCMLPTRATTEDDIRVLAGWGATLARFQITRDFGKVDANSDLAEYAAWVDSRLDNLADVLRWADARGMKICVDLHSAPGGPTTPSANGGLGASNTRPRRPADPPSPLRTPPANARCWKALAWGAPRPPPRHERRGAPPLLHRLVWGCPRGRS